MPNTGEHKQKMKNPFNKINLPVFESITCTVCLCLAPLCSSSRSCCIFFTYKEGISVLRSSSVCKSVSHLPEAQVRVSPLDPGYPRRERVLPHLGKLIFLVCFQLVVILWRDTCVLCFVARVLYLPGNEKKLSGCLQSLLVRQITCRGMVGWVVENIWCARIWCFP